MLSHEAVDLAVVVAGHFTAQLALDGPVVARVLVEVDAVRDVVLVVVARQGEAVRVTGEGAV